MTATLVDAIGGRMRSLCRLALVIPLALLGQATGACTSTHVAFAPPPDASAPVEARSHFFEQHRSLPAAREDLEVRTRLFEDRPSVSRRALSLAGGARVLHVEDLRPLVGPQSATASAIDEAVALDDRARLLLAGAAGVGALGLVGAGTFLAIDLGVTPSTTSRPTVELSPYFFGAVASFIVGAAGGGALATWGVSVRDDAAVARTRVYTSYDTDLRELLGLAAPEAAASVAAAPAAASPAPVLAPKKKHQPLADYATYDPTLDGKKQLADALTQATAEHKRVLVMFGGNWCKWCRALDATMRSDPAIEQLLSERYVFIHIDSDSNLALNDELGDPFKNGFPVLVVFSADGSVKKIQETGSLELGGDAVGHDAEKVRAFLAVHAGTSADIPAP